MNSCATSNVFTGGGSQVQFLCQYQVAGPNPGTPAAYRGDGGGPVYSTTGVNLNGGVLFEGIVSARAQDMASYMFSPIFQDSQGVCAHVTPVSR